MIDHEVLTLTLDEARTAAVAHGCRVQFQTPQGSEGTAWPDGGIEVIARGSDLRGKLHTVKGVHVWTDQPGRIMVDDGREPHGASDLLEACVSGLGALALLAALAALCILLR